MELKPVDHSIDFIYHARPKFEDLFSKVPGSSFEESFAKSDFESASGDESESGDEPASEDEDEDEDSSEDEGEDSSEDEDEDSSTSEDTSASEDSSASEDFSKVPGSSFEESFAESDFESALS